MSSSCAGPGRQSAFGHPDGFVTLCYHRARFAFPGSVGTVSDAYPPVKMVIQEIAHNFWRTLATLPFLGTLILTSCSGARPFGSSEPTLGSAAESGALVLVARGEPDTLASIELVRSSGPRFMSIPRLFNAGLVLLDGQELPRPYLAQQVPQLQSDSWRVLGDGRMETTYVLRPNLTWHDGSSLGAEDFVFGWQVYQAADRTQLTPSAISEMEEVTALDQRTVKIRWRGLFPRAGSLEAKDFLPLPHQRLQAAFHSQGSAALARAPFWSRAYVGLGPYRLTAWEPGSYLTASAFEAHAYGRPKVAQIKVLFTSDFDAVLGSLLSGEAQVTIDDALRFTQATALKREWSVRGGGTVLSIPNQWRHVEVQHRADYASPRTILDLRVRRALALSLDKDALNAGLFDGEAILSDSFVPPTVDYYRTVDAATVKYAFDPRRAGRLMNEAGYTRGPDGVFAHPIEGRFSGELRVNATQRGEAEVGLLAEAWHREGFDLRENTLPPAQTRMGEIRSTFPTLYSVGTSLGTDALSSFLSTRVAGPANRWVGTNRGGWSSREYDGLFDAFSTTLDRTERATDVAEMARLVTHSVAAISLYFNPAITAYATSLQGPHTVSPATDPMWNIYQWEYSGPPSR